MQTGNICKLANCARILNSIGPVDEPSGPRFGVWEKIGLRKKWIWFRLIYFYISYKSTPLGRTRFKLINDALPCLFLFKKLIKKITETCATTRSSSSPGRRSTISRCSNCECDPAAAVSALRFLRLHLTPQSIAVNLQFAAFTRKNIQKNI